VTYPLSLHDALPISSRGRGRPANPPSVQIRQLVEVPYLVHHVFGTQQDAFDQSRQVGHPIFVVRLVAQPLQAIALFTEVSLGTRSEEHTSELQSREK